jgi:hypothetical protein
MTEAAKLQAYMTGIFHDYDGMWAELTLVIAGTPEAAVRLAYPSFDDRRVAHIVAGEDNTYSIERCKHGDMLATGEPRIIRDMASLRLAGMHWEDERLCDGCEEYSEDVCSECNCCPECRDPECDACQAGTE